MLVRCGSPFCRLILLLLHFHYQQSMNRARMNLTIFTSLSFKHFLIVFCTFVIRHQEISLVITSERTDPPTACMTFANPSLCTRISRCNLIRCSTKSSSSSSRLSSSLFIRSSCDANESSLTSHSDSNTRPCAKIASNSLETSSNNSHHGPR